MGAQPSGTVSRGNRPTGARRTLRSCVVCGVALAAMSALATAATADPDPNMPSQAEVDAARQAAQGKARDVAAVQADLVLANQELQAASITAAKAAEAYNGAVYRLDQARAAAKAAAAKEREAKADVGRQQTAYADALASSYRLAPELSAVSALIEADGPASVLERYTALDSAESAMDANYDAYRAASTLATVASTQASDARAEAAALEKEAGTARATAQAAADTAAAQATTIAQRKTKLIAELARLQHVSVSLARQRQHALEVAAAQAAAEAAQHQAELEAQQAAEEQAEQEAQEQAEQDHSDDPTSDPTPTNPPVHNPPAAGGADAAIEFARDQIGEPYVWAAAGPDSWDCSGLTMGAWAAGGLYLPHYSVAQYDASTPISPSDLQPGDLVFWGDSGDPSSIYHVALYSGDGMIIQAPRTGRDVEEVSMYYWIPPNFYARP